VLNLPYTFLWRPRSARIFLYLSKLATQMVTSTPLENLSLLLYEPQNKNFNFGTTKTLILHARSIFFRRGHITKIWSKKIFFMKTLSKLGALTVVISARLKYKRDHRSSAANMFTSTRSHNDLQTCMYIIGGNDFNNLMTQTRKWTKFYFHTRISN
jgi:hypothetical protein